MDYYVNGESITTHSTAMDLEGTHRSPKSIGIYPSIPSTTVGTHNNWHKNDSIIKQQSVIEQITSLNDNSTYVNITETINATELITDTGNTNNSAEVMATSGRVTTLFNVANSTVDHLSAAGIAGITLGCVSLIGIISVISFILYRNRGFNRPQVLSDHCSNLDSSGYIDDTSVRDNSEEMYSLDNDSFLNSLEAMTIQNYWTDTVKHTKL